MRIKSEKDFWSGVMFLVVGLTFAWGATEYSLGTSARPGPGYFPLGLSLIMAALGAVVLFKSLTVETEGGDRFGAIAWRPLSVIVGSVALFGALLPWLGMFIALPILVISSAFASAEFRWVGAIVTAAVLTAFCWVIFIWGLNLTIPLLPAFMR